VIKIISGQRLYQYFRLQGRVFLFCQSDTMFTTGLPGLDPFTANPDLTETKRLSPAVNFSENETNYVLTIATPGFKREQFEIIVTDGILFVKASKPLVSPERARDRCEYHDTILEKSFTLPGDAMAFMSEAKYLDGELVIRIPKGQGRNLLTTSFKIYVY
jgi:HSP20 family molecular chaperone IbpA